MTRILQRVKREDESMISYYYNKLALIRLMEFKDEVAIDLLIGGLRNHTIEAAARAASFKTPAALLQYLKTIDAAPTHSK